MTDKGSEEKAIHGLIAVSIAVGTAVGMITYPHVGALPSMGWSILAMVGFAVGFKVFLWKED